MNVTRTRMTALSHASLLADERLDVSPRFGPCVGVSLMLRDPQEAEMGDNHDHIAYKVRHGLVFLLSKVQRTGH